MPIMSIKFVSLDVHDIKFLNEADTLYSIDFRATGEELDRDIPAMFKYENTPYWLGGFKRKELKRHVVVNETVSDECDDQIQHSAKRDLNIPHRSIYQRLTELPGSINKIWVGIPHPDADQLSRDENIDINYTYPDFLHRNDKVRQKELLQDLTPGWSRYDNLAKLVSVCSETKNGYLKKRHGAGGFSIIKLTPDTTKEKIQQHINDSSVNDWYIEESVDGLPWSAQCLRDQDGVVKVFGFSQQKIVDNTIYAGGSLIDVSRVSNTTKTSIENAINNLSVLLDNYVGFFGIDFIEQNDKIQILEFNIRLTAASLPALIRNKLGTKSLGIYAEDKKKDDLRENDIVFATDEIRKEHDTLEFIHPPELPVGYNCFIQLSSAKALDIQFDDVKLNEIKGIVNRFVSDVVSANYYNFWPFGWTVTLTLAESHCVLSSWHPEKNILIDVFCCKEFDHEKFAQELAKYFHAEPVIDEITERYLR